MTTPEQKEPTQLLDLDVVEVSLVPEGANGRRFAVFKSVDGKPAENDVVAEKTVVKPEAVEAPAPTIVAAAAAATTDTLPIKKAADGTDVLDVDAIPEAVRPLAQRMWDERAEAVRKAASLSDELVKERDQKMSTEFIAKASKLTKLGVKPDEFGLVMKVLHEKAPEQAAVIEKALTDANAAVEAAQKETAEAVAKTVTADAAVVTKTTELEEVKKSVSTLTDKVEKLASAAPAPKSASPNGTEAESVQVAKEKKSVFAGVF